MGKGVMSATVLARRQSALLALTCALLLFQFHVHLAGAQMNYPTTRRQGVPQNFGSNLLKGPTTLKFTDPVDVRPATPKDIGGGSNGVPAPSGRTDTEGSKPYRYLEPEVNEGQPSEETYAPTTATPSTPTITGRFQSAASLDDQESNKGGENKERLTASATSSSRGASAYYDVKDAEKKRRETLRTSTTPYGSGTAERTRNNAYGGFKSSGWSSSIRDREPTRDEGHWSDGGSAKKPFDDPSVRPEEAKDVELIESIASELRYLNSKLTALRDRRTKNERDQYRGDADRYRDPSNQDQYRSPGGIRDLERDRNRIPYESDRDYESYRKDHPLRIREKDPQYRPSQNRYPDADVGSSGSRRPFGRNAFGSGHGFPRELFDSRFYRGIRDDSYGRTAPRGIPASAGRAPDDYVSEETPEDLANLVPDRRAWESIVVNRRNLFRNN